MIALSLEHVGHVLCLGAHADDIEIGCGGTMLSLLGRAHPPAVTWVVFSAEGARAVEAGRSAGKMLAHAVKKDILVKNFRDGFFPHVGASIKETFEALKLATAPDLILTHSRTDLHQDHRLISELTWQTFRDHLILEYEIPKYDGDLGSPNVFVPLTEPLARRKVRHVVTAFRTQAGKRWFRKDVFLSLLRLRGMEANAPSGYAEAFYVRKLQLV